MTDNISMDKKYKTKSGQDVRILCIDAPGIYPVVGYIFDGLDEDDSISPVTWTSTWTSAGRSLEIQEHKFDLIGVKEKKSFWLNIYPLDHVGVMYNSRKEADILAGNGRIACINREYTEGEGLDK